MPTIRGRIGTDIPSRLRYGGEEPEDAIRGYREYRRAKVFFLFLFLILLLLAAAVDVCVGSYSGLGIREVFELVINRVVGDDVWTIDSITTSVFWDQRLPRVIVAIISGAGLGVAGAAMQSMLKNPLADPYTTGISSGAAFGATIAITLGITILPGNYGTILNAFVFGLVPAAVILLLSRFRKPSIAMMVLAGTSLMYIFNALQQYFMLIADPNSAQQVLSWTTGTISACTWDDVPVMLVIVILGTFAIQYLTKTLNAMNSGDTYAISLGVDVDRIRIAILITVSMIAAGIVSFTGIIGFVGLVSPHIARMFIGSDNRYLVPSSLFCGAGLMLAADIIAQCIAKFSLPIGIVTAMIGGPVFLFLIIRQRKEVWR